MKVYGSLERAQIENVGALPTAGLKGRMVFLTTDNKFYLDNGTNFVEVPRVAPGTSGNVLTSDGTNWTSSTPSTAPDSSRELSNLSLAVSVAANAMTIALKDKGGSDPSGASPVKIGFRSATSATGTYVQRSVTGALSMTVSSGSTLGTTNGNQHYLYVYAIDNAGTVELAISQALFSELSVRSTTAEGGAGAADTASVIYSTTARTNVAVRLIARLSSTQTTAGTWAAVPTEISLTSFAIGKSEITAKYTSAAGQSIPNNTATVVDFGTKVFDDHTAVTTGASWNFKAPEARKYLVCAGVRFASAAGWDTTELISLQVRNNATGLGAASTGAWATSSTNFGIQVTDIVDAAANDLIDVTVFQNSGGSRSLDSTASLVYIVITAL